MANPNAAETRPRLVTAEEPPATGSDETRRSVPPLVWVLAALLAFTLGASVLQTERLDRMTERAETLAARADSLQLELANARTQIHTYEMQRNLVRESVADIAERVAVLYEVVRSGSAPEPALPGESPDETSP
jgi:outer membrane murein-binding lipoprotein Lpp